MLSVLLLTEVMLLILSTYMMITKSTIICIVISNIISAIMVFIYCVLQAPDISITEAVIGTATSTILFALIYLYIRKTSEHESDHFYQQVDIRQRLFVLILCIIFYMLLVYVVQNLPTQTQVADSNDIPRVAGLYIKNAINDFGFSSIVTAVVAGYRAFDTMFENVVIFTACYGFYVLMKMEKDEDVKKSNTQINTQVNEDNVLHNNFK